MITSTHPFCTHAALSRALAQLEFGVAVHLFAEILAAALAAARPRQQRHPAAGSREICPREVNVTLTLVEEHNTMDAAVEVSDKSEIGSHSKRSASCNT